MATYHFEFIIEIDEPGDWEDSWDQIMEMAKTDKRVNQLIYNNDLGEADNTFVTLDSGEVVKG